MKQTWQMEGLMLGRVVTMIKANLYLLSLPSRKLRTSIKRVYVDKIKHKGRSKKKLLRIKIKIKIDPKLKSKSKSDCPKSPFTGHTLY